VTARLRWHSGGRIRHWDAAAVRGTTFMSREPRSGPAEHREDDDKAYVLCPALLRRRSCRPGSPTVLVFPPPYAPLAALPNMAKVSWRQTVTV